jgi:iduronate 2-sulfatase
MLRFSLVFLLMLGTVCAKRPNVLLICVDDLRPELKSFGAAHIHSPAMDSLAESGRPFHRHYVQAPTCGASRYTLLTGRYGVSSSLRNNNALFVLAKGENQTAPTMPAHFRSHGYRTVAFGKISHHPGGLGGKEWNDPDVPEMPGAWDLSLMPTGPWGTPVKAMHGYAGGIPRTPGKTPPSEHHQGDDLTYTDGWITREAVEHMKNLAAEEQPFFLAVGIMKPHLPFACPKKYRDLYENVEFPPIPHPEKPQGQSTWQPSGEFMGNYGHNGRDPRKDPAYADELRRSYAACVSYADAQVAQLLAQLEKLELTENTIVILWGDHGFHLGEHGVWGKHTLFEESLLAPLIIRAPGIGNPGEASKAVVETVDIYPTLCELADLPIPGELSGSSLLPQLKTPTQNGGAAVAYTGDTETIRTATHRLIRHTAENKPPFFELYDHTTEAAETNNIAADNPDLVHELRDRLDQQLKIITKGP